MSILDRILEAKRNYYEWNSKQLNTVYLGEDEYKELTHLFVKNNIYPWNHAVGLNVLQVKIKNHLQVAHI